MLPPTAAVHQPLVGQHHPLPLLLLLLLLLHLLLLLL
jgi:hypothetical protein